MGGKRRALPTFRYECLFCQKQFRWNRDLESHTRVHTGERPYPCEKCEQAFKTVGDFGIHFRSVHSGVSYKCDMCQKEWSNATNFRYHRKVAHNLKPEKGRNFVKIPKSCVVTSNVIKAVNNRRDLKIRRVQKRSCSGRKIKAAATVTERKLPEARINLESENVKLEYQQEGKTKVLKSSEGTSLTIHGELCFSNDAQKTSQLGAYEFGMIFSLVAQHTLKTQERWDPSFFLHMNRYDPEEFHTKVRKLEVEETVITSGNSVSVRNPSATTPKNHSSVQNKRGRPRKMSGEDEPTTVTITSAQLEKVQAGTLERINGDQVKCPFCSRAFHCWNFNAHLLTHTGEKPFSCLLCKSRFRQKIHLIKHVISFHRFGRTLGDPSKKCRSDKVKREAEADTSCAFCGKILGDVSFLEQHLVMNHKDKFQRE